MTFQKRASGFFVLFCFLLLLFCFVFLLLLLLLLLSATPLAFGKFPVRGLNSSLSSDLSHCRDNARSLTCCTTAGTPLPLPPEVSFCAMFPNMVNFLQVSALVPHYSSTPSSLSFPVPSLGSSLILKKKGKFIFTMSNGNNLNVH